MSYSAAWHVLPLRSTHPSVPPLLVKGSFENYTSYNVYITDSSRIWSENLDRRQIIRRALEEDTSIDPSEGTAQLKILLEKLEGSLRPNSDANLDLYNFRQANELLLTAKVDLPGPFLPLEWTFRLSLDSPKVLMNQLTAPLLNHSAAQHAKINALRDLLQEKDSVINKLVEKMERSGMDLSVVFPSLAGLKVGKGRNLRDVAEASVKGLGIFSEDHLDDKLAGISQAMSFRDSVEAFVESSSINGQKLLSTTNSHMQPEWPLCLADGQSGFGDRLRVTSTEDAKAGTQPSSSQGIATEPSKVNDDDFQTQITPPRARRPDTSLVGSMPAKSALGNDDDDDDASTTDECDFHTTHEKPPLEHHSNTASAHLGAPSTPKHTKKLGRIGGRNKTSSTTEEIANANASTGRSPDGSSPGMTASTQHVGEAGNDITKAKSKLGTIGGRKQTLSPDGDDDHGDLFIKMEDDLQPAISYDTPDYNVSDIDREEQKTVEPLMSKERDITEQDSQDKADAKRQELKRQLDEQKRGTTKKKRRF